MRCANRQLVSLVLVMMALGCGGTVRPASRAWQHDPVGTAVNDRQALQPAEQAIDELMRGGIDLQGRRWIGVDPRRDPERGELAVLVVDAGRMILRGCGGTPSPSCRIGRMAADGCAAVDDRTIVCDARLLAMLENVALDTARPDGILRTAMTAPLQQLDRFYERTYRDDLDDQLAQLRAEIGAAVVDRRGLRRLLSPALAMILGHEVAHIALGHVRDDAIVLRPAHGPGSEEALEAAADELAIRQLLRRHDLPYVVDALFAFSAIASYSGWQLRRAVGLPRGTTAKQAAADLARHPVDDGRFATTMASVCRNSHGDLSARMARLARIPEIARALSGAPHQLAALVEDLATRQARLCSGHDDAIRAVEAVRSAPPAIRLDDAGSLPRQPARYHWTVGSTQLLRKVTTTTTAFSDAATAPMTATRTTTVSVELAGFPAAHAAAISATLRRSDDAALAGRSVSVAEIIDDRGQVLQQAMLTRPADGAGWTPASPEDLRHYGHASSSADLYPETVRFPDEPIGVGAVWTVSGGGLLLTTYRLISWTGDRLVIEIRTHDALPPGGSATHASGLQTDEVDLGLPAAVHVVDEFQATAASTSSPATVTIGYRSTLDTLP